MDLDENQFLHLPEPIFGGDWVYHLYQRQCQVSHTLTVDWFYQYWWLCNKITQSNTVHNETIDVLKCDCCERSNSLNAYLSPSVPSSSCTLTPIAFNKAHTDHSLPTSHLSSAPASDCGVVETQHRTPSLPSPPQGVRCPPPLARAALTALL